AEAHKLAHGLNVVSQARHQIASLGMLEVAEGQLLQVGEYPVPPVRLAAAREAVNIDPPAIAEKSLQRGGAQNQKRILERKRFTGAAVERGIDAALDQPGDRHAGKIGCDKR